MRLVKARVQNYRSIIDTGVFDIESDKTILVGPNEAGKTVLLKGLQQLNKPSSIEGFDILRDFPRSKYNKIKTGEINVDETVITTGYFLLDEEDKKIIPEAFHNCQYKLSVKLNNKKTHTLENAPVKITLNTKKKEIQRMLNHMDKMYNQVNDNSENLPSKKFSEVINEIPGDRILSSEEINRLKEFYGQLLFVYRRR